MIVLGQHNIMCGQLWMFQPSVSSPLTHSEPSHPESPGSVTPWPPTIPHTPHSCTGSLQCVGEIEVRIVPELESTATCPLPYNIAGVY